jgi:hypothetical protein
MIWIGIFRVVFIAILFIYYVCLVGHLTGAYRMTYRRITFVRCIIPFYYWIVDPNKVN